LNRQWIFDPETLVILETAFDEAWITLKTNGSANIRPDELARRSAISRWKEAIPSDCMTGRLGVDPGNAGRFFL
jgi:hypothetical protein